MGSRTAFATRPPDAAADLQELQLLHLMNLQHRPTAVPCGSVGGGHALGGAGGKKQNGNVCFQILVNTGSRCHAYCQKGLCEVECTRALDFRAANAREANLWITGINSIVSDYYKEPAGVRPSLECC